MEHIQVIVFICSLIAGPTRMHLIAEYSRVQVTMPLSSRTYFQERRLLKYVEKVLIKNNISFECNYFFREV